MPEWANYATMLCWTRWGLQGLSINQFEGTPGGEPFLKELGFAAPYKDWWSLLVLLAMVGLLRVGLVLGTRYLTFEKR